MSLATLLQALEGQVKILDRHGNLDVSISAITDDSRTVSTRSLFVAVKGEQVDGHEFIPVAMRAGIAALYRSSRSRRRLFHVSVLTTHARRSVYWGVAFLVIRRRIFEMIGVTGTNGKTTTTYVCKALLEALHRPVGLIGTVAYQIGDRTLPATHTTPGSLELQQLLAKMVASGCATTVMEVSSHALAQDRTSGCEYDVAVFSNLTQDHLDFHRTMEEYFHAKLKLFTGLKGGLKANKRAIVNIDDPYGHRIVEHCPAPVWTYALKTNADLRAEGVQSIPSGNHVYCRDSGQELPHRKSPRWRAQCLQLTRGYRGGAQ